MKTQSREAEVIPINDDINPTPPADKPGFFERGSRSRWAIDRSLAVGITVWSVLTLGDTVAGSIDRKGDEIKTSVSGPLSNIEADANTVATNTAGIDEFFSQLSPEDRTRFIAYIQSLPPMPAEGEDQPPTTEGEQAPGGQ